MVEENLNRYLGRIIDNLKRSNYKIDDIRDSFNSFFQKQSKQKGILIVLCYISSLLLGILLSTIIILSSIFIGSLNYIITFIVFIALSILTYFCLNSFNINKKKILIITISLSILISITSWISYFFTNKLSYTLQEIGQRNITQSSSNIMSMTVNPISPLVITIILLLIYNSLPLIFLINKN